MDRRAVTFVECLVVIAILVTLFVVIAAGRPGAKPSSNKEPPQSWNLYTAKHDGHWFVKELGGGVCHHPDCPCRGRKAEEE